MSLSFNSFNKRWRHLFRLCFTLSAEAIPVTWKTFPELATEFCKVSFVVMWDVTLAKAAVTITFKASLNPTCKELYIFIRFLIAFMTDLCWNYFGSICFSRHVKSTKFWNILILFYDRFFNRELFNYRVSSCILLNQWFAWVKSIKRIYMLWESELRILRNGKGW